MIFDLTLLECPICRAGGFRLIDNLDNPTKLLCTQCHDAFPIRKGVICFQREFDDYSENYDKICVDDLVKPKTPSVVKRIFAQLIQERVRGITCDLGCGDGYVIQRVNSNTKIAVDIAFPYLERLPSSIMRLWGRVENVPLRSGCVDTIICTDVLEHVLDASLLASEIDRLLKPDGRALLGFPFEQDLSVYELPAYKAKYGKYKYVHLRSINDSMIAKLFPTFEVSYSHLITEGMELMEFKPYPIKFIEIVRRKG